MKALSIRQPWTWLILHGGKDIENRSWRSSVRGRVLIHAAKGMTLTEYQRGLFAARFTSTPFTTYFEFPRDNELLRGGIVGSVEIVDCVSQSESPWFCGPHGFVLRDPRPMQFVPMRGSLGFFDIPEHLLRSAA